MKAYQQSEELAERVEKKFADWASSLNGKKESKGFQRKKDSLDSFLSLGIPTNRHEEWKYSNPTKFLEGFHFSKVAIPVTKDAFEKKLPRAFKEGYLLVFENETFRDDLSDLPKEKVEIKYLNQVFTEKEVEVDAAHAKSNPFLSLNAGLATEGISLKVKKNAVLDKPLFIIYLGSAEGSFNQTRHFVEIEENAELSLVEFYLPATDQQIQYNQFIQIDIAKSARVDHYQLEGDYSNLILINNTQVNQQEGSVYNNTTITLGGKFVRNNLSLGLLGEHCEGFMNGLYVLNGDTHLDNHTSVDHTKPNSYSNELYKGLIDEKATAVFNGKIFVRQDAQKTNAFQSNKNILLSDSATVNTKPQLEIWADDVKCSHGCTTGSLDEEPLFYLKARGIPEVKARGLLMLAFAADVMDRIKLPAVKSFISAIVAERLGYDFEE